MSTTESSPASHYDYVIVGGGTAGCVLAARLSEDERCQVALIEAGPDDVDAALADPAGWPQLSGGRYDWGYEYAASPHVGGRRIGIPRGKVLGGSSSINALLWYRGHPGDYDEWEALGASGWNYDAMLPYFRRSEDWAQGASQFRGAGGPMRIETSPDPHPIALALLGAASELGLDVLADPNGATNAGAALSNLMVSGGKRCSAASGYLRPVRDRANLDVCCDSRAVELLFAGDRCVGVRHLVDGVPHTSHAAAEVVLCLGAVDTPRLLMLNGIGDPAALGPLGIDVRVGLPGVGQNLADHPLLMGLTFKARRPLGPIRDNGGGAMVNWRSSPVLAAPDLHAFVVQGPHTSPEQAREWGPDVFAISPGLMRSASVGWLTLSSDDPLAAPVIQPNFLAEPGDVDALVESIDFVLDLAQTAAYRELMERPLWPSRRLDRAEKVDFVRRACSTFFHTAGTCAIGTVVNPELRVLGVDALRIVDASVFPKLPSCNTTAPVIAVAERAGDLIRGREGEPG